MNDRAEEDEEMPEEMGALFLHCEGNDADGVDDPADECEEEQGQVFPQHTGQEKQAAPAMPTKTVPTKEVLYGIE